MYTVPPAASIAAAVSPIVPSSGDWPGLTVRAATATAAPSAANLRATSAPMPRLAPVTTATFPASGFIDASPPRYQNRIPSMRRAEGLTAMDAVSILFRRRF
ncbi:hypothetical protein Pme01_43080 [Planosporangium mesophilum]|uniref:Uncharacterized protein n=1 Tax=Planosporangium mesophilum TaxID=689768 RepID=A0A8J3X2A8_9ACTN|nr:hypothetical protein Pme01_43080 [Planosporangium mesophilum]